MDKFKPGTILHNGSIVIDVVDDKILAINSDGIWAYVIWTAMELEGEIRFFNGYHFEKLVNAIKEFY